MYKLTFDPYDIEKIDIEGVPVYLKSLPWANKWLEIRVGLSAGALEDKEGKEGTAHFFEHLPFNGTKKYPSFEKMEEIGRTVFMGTLNAYTSMTGTCFSGKVLNQNLEKGLDVLRDMMFFPIMNKTEIERERKVIIQEIWRAFDNVKREKLIEENHKNLYGDLLYKKQARAFGWSFTVKDISKKDLEDFHKKNYHKGNLVFVIAGNIDKEKIKIEIERFLKDLPNGEKLPERDTLKSIPLPIVHLKEISDKEYFGKNEESKSKSTFISAKGILPKTNFEDRAKLGMIRRLLRQIIFDEIRGKFGATYSPRVFWGERADHEFIDISVEILPDLKDKAIEIIKESVKKIIQKDNKIKNIFDEIKKADIDGSFTIETNGADLTDDIIHDIWRSVKINTLEEGIKQTEKTTFEDISKYTKENLDLEKFYWYIENP